MSRILRLICVSRTSERGFAWAILVLAFVSLGVSVEPALSSDKERVSTHYLSLDGQTGFVLDRTGADPLMRMDGSVETYILDEILGPRGDIIFKMEDGATILRQTNIGGVTLFDRYSPTGQPVIENGLAMPLSLKPVDAQTVRARAKIVAGNLSKRVGAELSITSDLGGHSWRPEGRGRPG